MQDAKNWVLIADSSRATLLETDTQYEQWKVLQELEHPASRLEGVDLMADDRGRTAPRQRDSARRAAMAPSTPPRQVEFEKFSRQLARVLEHGHDHNAYVGAVLIAPPAFLGLLRAAMVDTVARAVAAEIDKNLTHERPEDVIAMLRSARQAAQLGS